MLFLYLSRYHYTAELYKRLGGTGGVWEAFHSSAAPLLAQEAFRSEVLAPGTAAAGFPKFMVTPGWSQSQGKQKQISASVTSGT